MEEDATFVTPWKKRKTDVNYNLCIICQSSNKRKKCVQAPQREKMERLLEICKQRDAFGDSVVKEFVERMKDVDMQLLIDNKAIYHKECYAEFANKGKLERAKIRYNDAKQSNNPSVMKRKAGRPSLCATDDKEEEEEVRSTRSKVTPYDKTMCIICQTPGGKCRKVQFLQTGERFLEVANKLDDKGFYMRLNSITSASDAVANDTIYHLQCWVKAQRNARQDSEDANVQEFDLTSQVVSDIELLNMIEFTLSCPSGAVLNMNMINKRYKQLLQENGMCENDMKENYKPYLKELITNNIPNAKFIKSLRVNEPENILTDDTETGVVDAAVKRSNYDEMNLVYEVASLVRKELLQEKQWKFTGSFTNFTVPKLLSTLLKWILIGPSVDLNENNDNKELTKTVSSISQVVMQAVKTKRQVQYSSKENSNRSSYSTKETPLSVGLGLFLHQKTRSKDIIEMLSSLNLSCSYEKVLTIKESIAEEIIEQMNNNNGIYIPNTISPNKPLYFAIDNTDVQVDTPDGRGQLHGTAQVIYQQKDDSYEPPPSNIERKTNKGKKTDGTSNGIYSIKNCCTPQLENTVYHEYSQINSLEQLNLYKHHDITWTLLTCSEHENTKNVPTWAAFNSLTNNKEIAITNYCTIPLLHGSPTDWSNLYTALMISQGISVTCNPGHKTVISLDLQLYTKCIQLQSRDEIRYDFVFRMGELHVTFAMLKVIGKYIDASGLDESFIEADICGPNTLEQIKRGKHYKRSFEAFLTLYRTLFSLLVSKYLEEHAVVRIELKDICHKFLDQLNEGVLDIKDMYDELVASLNDINFFQLLEDFGKQFKNQPKFLWHYLKLFEIVLLFTRASRQSNWQLHLASLESFVKYFFAFDQINYARLSPVYLAQMYALKDKDPDTWAFLNEGNFSVNKSGIPFTGIGADHGLEQENKAMKVLGGIQGIANKKNTVDQHFIVAPVMNQILRSFEDNFLIVKTERNYHYQLKGTVNQRYQDNVRKLMKVFENHSIDFNNSNDVFNTITKAVLPEKSSEEFLKHESIGENMYKDFKDERITGNKPIWEKMTKRKLPTFVRSNNTTKIQLKDKVVELKEEKRLMTRFVLASRSREDIDLPKIFGNHEFSVVPRSMFSADGSMLLGSDKSTLLHQIEDMTPCREIEATQSDTANKVGIFDGMALLNQMTKDGDLKTCQDLADKFVKNVTYAYQKYKEIRVTFDKYQQSSLKDSTRHKRTQGQTRHYKISPDANIEGITMKMLLSHVMTKRDLTKFLGDELVKKLNVIGKRYDTLE